MIDVRVVKWKYRLTGSTPGGVGVKFRGVWGSPPEKMGGVGVKSGGSGGRSGTAV